MRYLIYLIPLLAGIYSCSPDRVEKQTDSLPPIFPDYTAVSIPYNIAPLNFEMANVFHVRAEIFVKGNHLATITGKRLIKIPEKQWKGWLREYKGEKLEFIISSWSETYPNGIRYAPFTMDISPHKIDEWIAYRLIEPGYEYWNQMGIYQRQLSSFTEKPIVTNNQNHQGCLNCHSFHNYSADRFMFHARGKNGTTVMLDKGVPRRIDFEKITAEVKATYPFWHPSGRYIAFSSNDTYQSFYHFGKMPVEVYDVASDLFIYDVENNRVITDTRFTEKTRFETFPAFSPDGKFLYYCCATADKMPMANRELKYALCRVSFDEQTGNLGEKVDTLYNPQAGNGSISFPRLSPCGKYILYTEASSATFPIWHKEADLKMIRLADGEEIDTRIINSDESDSYHSWSSNGRWIIYSSRRIDGRYTRLYIAGVDEKGHFGKPFLLPQNDPSHNTLRLKSYNIPEFINQEVRLNKKEVTRLFD